MRQEIVTRNDSDASGNPAGGESRGIGIHITWQNGPLGKDCCNRPNSKGTHAPDCDGISERANPNGAFVEGVLKAALDRVQYYQTTWFACPANDLIIRNIQTALACCDLRTRDREKRGVEGTHNI